MFAKVGYTGSTYTGTSGAQQSTCRNHQAERWGNPGEALLLQMSFSTVPATARPCWMVRGEQAHGGDRRVGGKQDRLPGPYLPTKMCCARWGSMR